MKCSVSLVVRCPQAVYKAIQPDNLEVPEWLRVECTYDEELQAVSCLVEAECGDPRRILSLRSTADDILQSIKASLDALQASEGGSPG